MRIGRFVVAASLFAAALGTAPERAVAQVTTAVVRGVVKGDDGAPMAEVEVTLVDEETGTTKTATSRQAAGSISTASQVSWRKALSPR